MQCIAVYLSGSGSSCIVLATGGGHQPYTNFKQAVELERSLDGHVAPQAGDGEIHLDQLAWVQRAMPVPIQITDFIITLFLCLRAYAFGWMGICLVWCGWYVSQ